MQLKMHKRETYSIILISIDPSSFDEKNNPDNFYQDIKKLGLKLLIAKNGQPIQGMIN